MILVYFFNQSHRSKEVSYLGCFSLRGWNFLNCLHFLMNLGKCTCWICYTHTRPRWSCRSKESWTSARSTHMALACTQTKQVKYKLHSASYQQQRSLCMKWSHLMLKSNITFSQFKYHTSHVTSDAYVRNTSLLLLELSNLLPIIWINYDN